MRQVLSIPSQLGALMRAARKEAGLSQAEFAERLGISQSRVSHMEHNPGSVSVEQLLAIFGVLELEIVVGSRGPDPTSASQSTDATKRNATTVAASLAGSPTSEW